MSDHILIPIDGSEQSYAGLVYGLVSFPDASFTTVHVIDRRRARDEGPGVTRPWEERAEELAERYHERATELAEDYEQSIETETRFGTPHKEIIRFALDADVDHVIAGSHGRSPIRSPFLGRVSEAILRRLPVRVTIISTPVETVQDTSYPGDVLVPLDGSRHAKQALEWVLKSFPAADITAIHVIDVPFDMGEEISGTYVEGMLDELREPAQEVLDEAVAIAQAGEMEIDTELTTGKPASSILAYATMHEIDQVVMGSAGRSDLSNVLVGSVAERVARDASLPVTLVR